MTETKHTLEPWVAEEPKGKYRERLVIGKRSEFGGDPMVCLVYNSLGQGEANARLIISAPDLLDYCKLHDGLDHREPWALKRVKEMAKGGRPFIEVMDEMRNAAIAKAEPTKQGA